MNNLPFHSFSPLILLESLKLHKLVTFFSIDTLVKHLKIALFLFLGQSEYPSQLFFNYKSPSHHVQLSVSCSENSIKNEKHHQSVKKDQDYLLPSPFSLYSLSICGSSVPPYLWVICPVLTRELTGNHRD